MLISSKGKSKYKLIFSILGTALIILGIIFFFIIVINAPSRLKTTGVVLAAASVGFGLVAFAFATTRCSGYINVYADHVEGKGLHDRGMNDFYLTNAQIRSITLESYYLCLHTDIGMIKIICDTDSRKAIMRHFMSTR